MTPKRGEVYKHFKGGKVHVLGIGWNAETKEKMVVFELSGNKQLIGMALHRFSGNVEGEPRFRKVDDDG